MSAANDPALLRRINAVTTLRVMRGAGPLTLTHIVELTGLSRRTAEAVVNDLITDGWVEEFSADTSSGRVGRPARSFRFRAESGYVVGLDIGAYAIRVMLADFDGVVVSRHIEPVHTTDSRAQRLAATRNAIRACLQAADVSRDKVRAVAVGTPGLVNPSGHVTLCQVLPEWSDFALADELRRSFSCPITIENDVNVCAVGERWNGAAVGADNLVWVLTGRRTNAGVIIGGELYRGHDGAAGEIGWLPELGWKQVRDQALSYLGASGTDEGGEAEAIVEAAAADDPNALAAIDKFAETLSHGIAALVLVVNPQLLVIGGGLAVAGTPLLDALRRHLEPRCLRLPDIRASHLGLDAVAAGAVRIALDHVEETLFSPSL